MVRGVCEGNRVAFFGNCITDADSPCYVHANLSWEAISNKAVNENAKYRLAAEELRGSITPLAASGGATGPVFTGPLFGYKD